jgi:putative endonuclease
MLLLKRQKLLDREILGRWGEKRCEKFLKAQGLFPLTKNYSCKAGEIDLIMVDANRTIVFVEVKTRTDESFTPAETLITAEKQQKIYKTARYFLAAKKIENRPYRFDAVTITLDKTGREQINHYKNAFER